MIEKLSASQITRSARSVATRSTRQPTLARGGAPAAAKTGPRPPILRAFAAGLALCARASGPLSGRANNRARKPCATVGVHYRALGSRPAVADHPGPETGLRWPCRMLRHRLGRLVACGTPPSVEARGSRHSDRSGSHTSASWSSWLFAAAWPFDSARCRGAAAGSSPPFGSRLATS